MEFKKYQHIERFGASAVEGIENGKCYIFPKIDGTNCQVYLDEEGNVKAGSRNRELTFEDDNRGFYTAIQQDERIKKYLRDYPDHRLYGEWLVPHNIRTYCKQTWNKFYVFDVCTVKEEREAYIPYEEYSGCLERYNIDYIPVMKIIENGILEDFGKELDKNMYLIQEGKGTGEGIVIKNYNFRNKYGRVVWAKIISSEYKNAFKKTKTNNQEKQCIEEKIVEQYVTHSFIEKEYAKLVNDFGGDITTRGGAMLCGKVWNLLIVEEMWNIVKKFKNPTIDFKLLNQMVNNEIRKVKSDLF